ncbi:MAG: dihydrodipicolinate synthase family protein [Burkholderiaceae bacterium]
MATRLRGVIAAAATPLNADFSIDTDGLIEHCRNLLAEGCDGINLLGTTGEATSFSVEQRIEAMQAVARSGLPLSQFMVGTGAASLTDTVRLTRIKRDLDFAGALVLPPFYYKPINDAGLDAYFDELIRRVGADLRFYLYHFPQLSGVPYSLEFVQALKKKYPRQLLGLKDSSGDLSYSIAMAAGVADFDVFPSAEGTLKDADRYQWAGCISATVNITARAAAAAWKARGTAEGERAATSAAAQRAILTRVPVIAAVKQALAVKYQRPEWARVVPPLHSLTPEQAAQQTRELATCGIDATLVAS